jgi:hypothetical protein
LLNRPDPLDAVTAQIGKRKMTLSAPFLPTPIV